MPLSSIPFQYIQNDTTGKILSFGYSDLSNSVPTGYTLVKGPLPANFVQEVSKTGFGLIQFIETHLMQGTPSIPALTVAEQVQLMSKLAPLRATLERNSYNPMTSTHDSQSIIDELNNNYADYDLTVTEKGNLVDLVTAWNSSF